MKGYFVGRLEVTPVPTVGFGRTTWELIAPLSYKTGDGVDYTVPDGFLSDLASIPWFLYPIMRPAGAFGVSYGPAAVLHDWALQQDMPSKEAHKLFKEALLATGASKFLANMMYCAVNRPKASEQTEPDDITQGEV